MKPDKKEIKKLKELKNVLWDFDDAYKIGVEEERERILKIINEWKIKNKDKHISNSKVNDLIGEIKKQ